MTDRRFHAGQLGLAVALAAAGSWAVVAVALEWFTDELEDWTKGIRL